MPGTRSRPDRTPFVPLAADVTGPSALVIGPARRRRAWDWWWRPLLFIGATAAALALLLAARPW